MSSVTMTMITSFPCREGVYWSTSRHLMIWRLSETKSPYSGSKWYDGHRLGKIEQQTLKL